jgi:hypothetical protein
MSWIDELINLTDDVIDDEIKNMDTDDLIAELQKDYQELQECYRIEDEYGEDENDYDADYYENAGDIGELEEIVAQEVYEIIKRKEIDRLTEVDENIYDLLEREGII